MSGFILGLKYNQSQAFTTNGERIPVTAIVTSPCYIIDVKWPTSSMPQYSAITLGFGQTKNIKKTIQGQLKKAGIKTPLRFLREFRLNKLDNAAAIEENGKKGLQIGEAKLFIGDEVKPSLIFKEGDLLDVAGVSKGKGFQGVVKRHGFAGGPKTHGQSDRLRAPGSMGQTTTPGRVYKGKRMAGRMGNERVKVQNLKVFKVDDAGITVRGLVPGSKNGLLEIRSHGL